MIQHLPFSCISEILLFDSPHFTDNQNCINLKFMRYIFLKIYWVSFNVELLTSSKNMT